MSTKTSYSNCYFGILYLIARNKIDKVVLVSSNTKYFPYHFVGINKRGHALHFATTLKGDTHAPFWFEGTFIGISKKKQVDMLRESNRKIHGTMSPALFFLLSFIFMAVVSPIWCLCWGLYPFYRVITDLYNV